MSTVRPVEFGSEEAGAIRVRDKTKLPTSRKKRLWVIETRRSITKRYSFTARSQDEAIELWENRVIGSKPNTKEERGDEYVVAAWAEGDA